MRYGRRRQPDPAEEAAEAESWLADYRASSEDSGDEFPSSRRQRDPDPDDPFSSPAESPAVPAPLFTDAPLPDGGRGTTNYDEPTGAFGARGSFDEPTGAFGGRSFGGRATPPPFDEPAEPFNGRGAPPPAFDDPTGGFNPPPRDEPAAGALPRRGVPPSFDEPTGRFAASPPRDEPIGGFNGFNAPSAGSGNPPRDEPTGGFNGFGAPPRDEPTGGPGRRAVTPSYDEPTGGSPRDEPTGSFGATPSAGTTTGSFGAAPATGPFGAPGSFGAAPATGSFGAPATGSFGAAPPTGATGSFGATPPAGATTGSFGATPSAGTTGSFGATPSAGTTGSFGAASPPTGAAPAETTGSLFGGGSAAGTAMPRRPPAASPHPDEEPIFKPFDPSAPPVVPPSPPQEEPILKYMSPRERTGTRSTYGGRRRAPDQRSAAVSGPPASAPVTPAPVAGPASGRRRRYREDEEPSTATGAPGSAPAGFAPEYQQPYPDQPTGFAEAPPRPGFPEPSTRPGFADGPPRAGFPDGPQRPGFADGPPRAGFPEQSTRPGFADGPPRAGFPSGGQRPGSGEAPPRAGFPQQPGFSEQPALPARRELPSQPTYAEPAAYAEAPGYTEPPGYGEAPGYPEAAGYSAVPGHAKGAGYAEPSGYAEGPGYAEAPGYTEPAGYAEPGYAGSPGYASPARYPDDPRQGGYRGEPDPRYGDGGPYPGERPYADDPPPGAYAAVAAFNAPTRQPELPAGRDRSDEPDANHPPSLPPRDSMRTISPDTTGDMPRVTGSGSPRVGSGNTGTTGRVAAVGSATTGSLPRIGPSTTGSLRPVRIDPVRPNSRRPSNWTLALTSVVVLIVLAVCGTSTYFVFQNETDGDKGGNNANQGNAAVPPRDISTRDADPDPLTEAEVFPLEAIGGQTGNQYTILKKEAKTDCSTAATDDLIKLLSDNGCSQVVRGTMKSSDGTYFITAGIFNLKDEAAAINAHENIENTVKAQKGRFTGLLAGAGTEVLVRAPMVLGWHARGHYLAYCVIARVDGQGFDAESQGARDQIQADILSTHLRDAIIGGRTQPKANTPAGSGAPSPSQS